MMNADIQIFNEIGYKLKAYPYIEFVASVWPAI